MYGSRGGIIALRVALRPGAAVQAQIAQRAQEMMEQRYGIMHILPAIPLLDGVENFFKQFLPVADARIGTDGYCLRHSHALGIVLGQRALEMHPIDSPRRLSIGPIGMGQLSWQYEALASLDLMASGAEGVPPTALHAINQHPLADRLAPLAEMVSRRRVEAYVGDLQSAAHRVALQGIGYHLGHHYRPLALKTLFDTYHSKMKNEKY